MLRCEIASVFVNVNTVLGMQWKINDLNQTENDKDNESVRIKSQKKTHIQGQV